MIWGNGRKKARGGQRESGGGKQGGKVGEHDLCLGGEIERGHGGSGFLRETLAQAWEKFRALQYYDCILEPGQALTLWSRSWVYERHLDTSIMLITRYVAEVRQRVRMGNGSSLEFV